MKANRKHLVAAAVAMALSGSAVAGTTFFSITGTGVANAKISSFDWAGDNLLILNTNPAGGLTAGDLLTVVSQGRLGSGLGGGLIGPLVPALGTNTFTYQMKTFVEFVDATATSITYKAPDPSVAGTFFEIYYAPVNQSDQFTGCGYGDHQSVFCTTGAGNIGGTDPALIYKGSATMQIGTATTLNQTPIAAGKSKDLDQYDTPVDNSKGVNTTNIKDFSITLDVNTVSFDPLFFTSIVTSLSVDISHEETGKSPFTSVTPSDEVQGNGTDGAITKRAAGDAVDFFGSDLENNIGATSCGGGGGGDGFCGLQLQTDASSAIQGFVPEPHSLALLGLGLAGLGWSTRRRAKATAV